MASGAPAENRPLSPADPALHPGWPLLEYLLSLGADEFAVRFMHWGDDAGPSDQLVAKLAFASLGERTRECTVTYATGRSPRPVNVWRLDSESLEVLRDLMPDGILAGGDMRPAWAEDLCVYRCGELLLGTVTHEQYAFLRLSDDEWEGWDNVR